MDTLGQLKESTVKEQPLACIKAVRWRRFGGYGAVTLISSTLDMSTSKLPSLQTATLVKRKTLMCMVSAKMYGVG